VSRCAVLLCCLFAPLSAFACEVQIRNASTVDLSIPLGSERSISLAPGSTARIPIDKQLWLDFGADAHEYNLAPLLAVLCPAGSDDPVGIWAGNDGLLWLESTAQQPEGFPARPVSILDLTGSPSNKSFKPNPLRRFVQMYRWRRCIGTRSARCGSA
jgi:hypothetical protein